MSAVTAARAQGEDPYQRSLEAQGAMDNTATEVQDMGRSNPSMRMAASATALTSSSSGNGSPLSTEK